MVLNNTSKLPDNNFSVVKSDFSSQRIELQDFYACAFVILNGIEMKNYYYENNLTTFVFNQSTDLINCLNDYYQNKSLVDPKEYSVAIRNLKALIHSNRMNILTSSTGKLNNGFYNKFEDKTTKN